VRPLPELLELMPDVLVVVEGGRITAWRGSASRLLGWSEDEALGNQIDELLGPHDENGNTCSILEDASEPTEREYIVSTKDRSDLWVGVTSAPIPDASSDSHVLVVRDVQRRKQIDLEKSEVISAISHELRSPLASIKGWTSTLLRKWDKFGDEEKKHFLLTIEIDTDRVARMINELLDLSRIETGRLQLRRKMLDVSEIADRVVHRLQASSDKHKIVVDLPNETPNVFADADKIEQVLTNLVENAIKYTDAGTIRVGAVRRNGRLEVVVSDEGQGISEKDHLSVFGKFFRLEDRTSNPSGTGLGLYLAKGLIEAHGGNIWVDEADSGGAAFTFSLPTELPEPELTSTGQD